MQKRTLVIFLGGICLLIVIGLLTFLTIRLFWLSDELESRNELLVGEIRANREISNVLTQGFVQATDDLNSIRKILGLEETKYRLPDENENISSTDASYLMFFKALDTIVANNQAEKLSLGMARFKESATFSPFRSGFELVQAAGGRYELSKAGWTYYAFEWDTDSEKIRISPLAGGKAFFTLFDTDESAYFDRTLPEAEEYIAEAEEEFQEFLETAEDTRITAVLKEKGLTLVRAEDSFSVTRDDTPYLVLRFDKTTREYRIGTETFSAFDSFIDGVIERIPGLDTRSPGERLIAYNIDELSALGSDEGFQSLLDSRGLSLLKVPREDTDYFYFDLLTDKNERVGSFAVQKMIGEIYVMDKDDVPISSVVTISDTGAEKKK